MKTYNVLLTRKRTNTYTARVAVEAKDVVEARIAALKMADEDDSVWHDESCSEQEPEVVGVFEQ